MMSSSSNPETHVTFHTVEPVQHATLLNPDILWHKDTSVGPKLFFKDNYLHPEMTPLIQGQFSFVPGVLSLFYTVQCVNPNHKAASSVEITKEQRKPA